MLERYRLARLAEIEFEEAVEYYDTEASLGGRFAREVHRVIDHARTFPLAGTLVDAPTVHWPIRRFRLNPAFPYDVVAMAVEDESLLLVLAVSHHKRNPTHWFDRSK